VAACYTTSGDTTAHNGEILGGGGLAHERKSPSRPGDPPVATALAIPGRPAYGAKEGRSFLKKRTKKPLFIEASAELIHPDSVPSAMDKSFLLLFFKKEVLSFPRFPFR